MITLQIDGAGQTGTSILVKAEGAVNCRLAQTGRNFTITTPTIYTLTQELIIDAEGKGIMEISPALSGELPDDGASINIHFNDLIDRLVAELVLGWKPICGQADITAWLESCGHKEPPEPHWSRIWIDPAKEGYRALAACDECGNMPWFSRDIADAWPIAKQQRFSLFPRLERETIHERVVGWAAVYGSNAAEAPTAPMAICLAALRAVGVEEGLKSVSAHGLSV